MKYRSDFVTNSSSSVTLWKDFNLSVEPKLKYDKKIIIYSGWPCDLKKEEMQAKTAEEAYRAKEENLKRLQKLAEEEPHERHKEHILKAIDRLKDGLYKGVNLASFRFSTETLENPVLWERFGMSELFIEYLNEVDGGARASHAIRRRKSALSHVN